MKTRLIKWCRLHSSMLLYLLFGGVTTLISIGTYELFRYMLPTDIIPILGEGSTLFVANSLSWVITVAVAFFLNRKWVFHTTVHGLRAISIELLQFYLSRLLTLGIENGLIYLLVTIPAYYANWYVLSIKIAATILVVVLNFVLSKLMVFKKHK